MKARLWLLAAVTLAAGCSRGKNGRAGDIGDPGPEGQAPDGPRIDAISPAIGSIRNRVTITGTNFSAVIADDDVRFGGQSAPVYAASATSLEVQPADLIPLGSQPVTVAVGQKISSSAGFTLVDSATPVAFRAGAPVTPGEAISLADGRILVPDASGAILTISTAGIASALSTGQGLVAPSRLVTRADGTILVCDVSAGGLFRVDPATGALHVVRWGHGYSAATEDSTGALFLIAPDGSIEKIAANGTLTPAFATLPAGSTARDLQVIGTDVFVAIEGVTTGIVKFPSATSGSVATPVVVTGVTAIHALTASGGNLIAGGTFTATNSQEGVAQITTAGTITALTADASGQGRYGLVSGALVLQSGALLISDSISGGVETLTGTTLAVAAGTAAKSSASLRVAGATYASVYHGSFVPGWILETRDDGSSRIVAQGRFAEISAGDDPQHLLAVRPDDADVVEVTIAGGSVVPRFTVSGEMSLPVGLARDAAGNHYVASPTANVLAKYDAAGVLVNAAFSAVANPAGLRAETAYLFVTEPSHGTVDRVFLPDGSIQPWIGSGAGVISPAQSFRDSDPNQTRLFVVDPGAGRLWIVDVQGFVAPYGPAIPGASSISQREDGMLVIDGAAGSQLLTP